MKSQDRTSLIFTFIRLAIGLLFVFSAVTKLVHPTEYFEYAISFYKIIPDALLTTIAQTLPWIEMFLGTFLLLGFLTPQTSGTLATFTIAFQLLLAQALLRKLDIDDCGCFGAGSFHLTLYQSFAVDTVLALLLLKMSSLPRGFDSFSIDRYLEKTTKTSIEV